MRNNFDKSVIQQNIFYLSHDNKDIITIEMNSQYILLIGKIDFQNNLCEIKYILEFDSKKALNIEKNIILNSNIDNYMKDKIVYNEINNNDYFSPIIDKNKIIGNCYKYKHDLDYTSCINYSKILPNYLSKTILSYSIKLYSNYQNILKKMSQIKSERNEKYYIISKNLLSYIRLEDDYQIIKEKLKINNYKEDKDKDMKYILSLIKSFPDNYINQYIVEFDIKGKYKKEEIKPEKISFKYFDKSQNEIMIYNNFQLYEKETIELFFDDINKMNNYYLECTLSEGKIIIHYPDNTKKNQYISVIGTLNEQNEFITEFLLIYNNKKEKNNHLKSINGGLIKYLNGLQLFNNSSPIINNNYKELGIIIKYDSCNKNNYSMNKNNQNNNINFNNYKNEIIQKQTRNSDINIKNNPEKESNLITKSMSFDYNYNFIKLDQFLYQFEENNEINKLKQQLNDEKNKNEILTNKISQLEQEIIEIKNKNKILEENEKIFKNQIDNKKKEYEVLKISYDNLIKLDSKENLGKILLEKENKIKELQEKLSRFPFELKKGEELMTVNFKSLDQKIQNYSIICKKSDIFSKLEEKLYIDNSGSFDVNNFIVNGLKIDKSKSLEENKIHNNDIIIISKYDK